MQWSSTFNPKVHKHFLDTGGYYPVGGASEIAYNMIPIIERAGGKVLVRANVVRILYEGGKVSVSTTTLWATDLKS